MSHVACWACRITTDNVNRLFTGFVSDGVVGLPCISLIHIFQVIRR
ncbi:Uncharacterised protein [Vibrio cholerae]|nr:Uncharacterised protein [Vibrio cholerae]